MQKYKIDSVKNINIGIIGHRGTGKSSLINSVIGRKVASVDVVEAQQEPLAYMLETIDETTNSETNTINLEGDFNFAIVDLPGYNTINQEVDTYFVRNYLFLLDILVIVINEALTKSCIDIINEALKYDKFKERIIIVRSKIDESASNMRIIEYTNNKNEIDLDTAVNIVAEKTFNDVKEKLHSAKIEYQIPVFVISAPRLNELLHPGYLNEMKSFLRGGIESIPKAQEIDLVKIVLEKISTSRYV